MGLRRLIYRLLSKCVSLQQFLASQEHLRLFQSKCFVVVVLGDLPSYLYLFFAGYREAQSVPPGTYSFYSKARIRCGDAKRNGAGARASLHLFIELPLSRFFCKPITTLHAGPWPINSALVHSLINVVALEFHSSMHRRTHRQQTTSNSTAVSCSQAHNLSIEIEMKTQIELGIGNVAA